MPWSTDVMWQRGQAIHGLHCPFCARFPLPQWCSPLFGNLYQREERRQGCWVSLVLLRLQYYNFSIAWSLKFESQNSGVSHSCPGYPPYLSFSTCFCWDLWMGHPMFVLPSFRLLRCFSMSFTVSMLASMLKEMVLSLQKMEKSTWTPRELRTKLSKYSYIYIYLSSCVFVFWSEDDHFNLFGWLRNKVVGITY